jgi:hypothetical protein
MAADSDEISVIRDLSEQGVLSRELVPEPDYWHWRILKPESIPDSIKHLIVDDEIRW